MLHGAALEVILWTFSENISSEHTWYMTTNVKIVACRSRAVTVTCRILTCMARPHKGPRKQIKSEIIDPQVKAQLLSFASYHSLDLSPYVADLMAIHVGMSELAVHLKPQMFEVTPPVTPAEPDNTILAPRVPEAVYEEIVRRADACGLRLGPYIAAVCTSHVRGTPLPQPREVLPLGA